MRCLFLFLALLLFTPLSALAATTSAKPEVEQDSSAPSRTDATGGMVSITAKVGTATPYENQPVLYTLKVVVRTNISSTTLSNFSIDNAIVEQQGKPDISDQMEGGVPARVAEFHYIITPLQPGKIIIPPVVLQGTIQPPDLAALADPSRGGLAFSKGMQQSLKFFSTFGGEPFSVASNATQLDVKPPATTMDPWLPLTSLKISEEIDATRSIHVGEQMVRKITLAAVGAVGSQLPDIEAQQNHSDFSVFIDKPAMGEDVDSKTGAISGWRTDTYDLIAQRTGHLVLPAIRISWWDIANNKAAIAVLQERIVDVLPEAVAQRPPADGAGASGHANLGQSAPPTLRWLRNTLANGRSVLVYGLAGILIAALLFTVFQGLNSQRKIFRLWPDAWTVTAAERGPEKSTPGAASEGRLGHVRTAEELKNFLQAYAHRYCGTSRNASLESIFSILPVSHAGRQRDDAEAVIMGIGAALYAGKIVEIEGLKKRSRRLIAALRGGARNNRKSEEKLGRLNPS
jgi:hypothetical protein